MEMGRREFIKASAALGAELTLAFYLPAGIGPVNKVVAGTGTDLFMPNAFIRIGIDSCVTVVVKHLEMGQGVYTGLPTLVAEELDADWAQINVEGAPANAKLYNNRAWGPVQGTGQSTAMANSFDQMRKVGAVARAMLVAAASDLWKVPVDEIVVSKGVVSHRKGTRKATFGELATRAAQLPIPETVSLKEAKDFQYIGQAGKPLPRKDGRSKADGSAQYTIDVRQPGMLTALVAHPPLFGATVKSFDATKAKAVPGVVDVVQIPTGVAVLARGFWPAKLGRELLAIEWDDSAANKLGSTDILRQYKELAKTPGLTVRSEGDVDHALTGVAQRLSAAYEFPYLAHAAMEPLDCAMAIGGDGCQLWHGEQFQTLTQLKVASILGLKLDQVKIDMLLAGGSFGRRGNPRADYQAEAASIVKAIGGRAPVKLLWTREDDMRAGFYRPLNYHTLEAGLDDKGNLVAWRHRIVGQSILDGTPLGAAMISKGVDPMSVEGARDMPYHIPNLQLDLHSPRIGVPVLWWRSVGHTHTAFSIETFIDELAEAAKKDPIEFRRTLLDGQPRLMTVLNLVAEKSGWGKPMASGRGRGIALHQSFNTCVAQVAEVTVTEAGALRVDRVTCAVDCGIAVNPRIIGQQMQGGIGFGLSAALKGAITLSNGRVEQSNFHDYPLLRIDEMPHVDVHIVSSSDPPTGVGEPGVPPIAPAVCNAIYMATGQRIRSLPISQHDLKRKDSP